jgi:hypothetical protein
MKSFPSVFSLANDMTNEKSNVLKTGPDVEPV